MIPTSLSRIQDANVYYKNFTDARAAPLRTGDPGYAPHLNRDGDGLACE
ncbi:excalibur calcium-binding domain-containing protein [Metabacillus sp. GX 13764]|nr:excalibur calcium-binding domain-containing protein [Metabacillus kandeliae]MCD7034172.1 excalibur calcium-binding domain-containing protein [Metabacillus kandeliae]